MQSWSSGAPIFAPPSTRMDHLGAAEAGQQAPFRSEEDRAPSAGVALTISVQQKSCPGVRGTVWGKQMLVKHMLDVPQGGFEKLDGPLDGLRRWACMCRVTGPSFWLCTGCCAPLLSGAFGSSIRAIRAGGCPWRHKGSVDCQEAICRASAEGSAAREEKHGQ